MFAGQKLAPLLDNQAFHANASPISNQEIKALMARLDAHFEECGEVYAKQHSGECYILTCTKEPCYEWVPDKIVGHQYFVDRKTKERL